MENLTGWQFKAMLIGVPILVFLLLYIFVWVIGNLFRVIRYKFWKIRETKKITKLSLGGDINWEIHTSEARERNNKIIQEARTTALVTLPIIGLILVVKNWNDFKENTWMYIIVIVLVVVMFYIIDITKAFIIGDKYRRYSMRDDGIEVAKGKDVKFYKWEEFECFSDRFKEERYAKSSVQYQKEEIEEITGKVFYLKLNVDYGKFFLVTPIVFVRSEPDNSEKVYLALFKKLPEVNIGRPSFTRCKFLFK